jgi:hypothetical protein
MPLSLAAEKWYEAVVKQLLATVRANIDSKDKVGRTPLSWAVANRHEVVAPRDPRASSALKRFGCRHFIPIVDTFSTTQVSQNMAVPLFHLQLPSHQHRLASHGISKMLKVSQLSQPLHGARCPACWLALPEDSSCWPPSLRK